MVQTKVKIRLNLTKLFLFLGGIRGVLKRKSNKKKSLIFASIHPLPSLNQGQGSVFTLRECAQSIPHLEKPRNRRFSHKNPKMFDFRFITPIPSLNQGQGSVFMLRECAESISRIKLPLRTYFLQKFSKKFFSEEWPWVLPP